MAGEGGGSSLPPALAHAPHAHVPMHPAVMECLEDELRADAFGGAPGAGKRVLESLVGALPCPFAAVFRSLRRKSLCVPRMMPALRCCANVWSTAWRCHPDHQRANSGFSWQPDDEVLSILRQSDLGFLTAVAQAVRRIAERAMWVISDPTYPDHQFQYVTSVAHVLPADGSLPEWLTHGPPQVVGVAPEDSKQLRFAIYAHAVSLLKGEMKPQTVPHRVACAHPSLIHCAK